MKKNVVSCYIETPDGKVFRTATMGDVVPDGSTWVIKSDKDNIRIPYGSTDHVRKMQQTVDKFLDYYR